MRRLWFGSRRSHGITPVDRRDGKGPVLPGTDVAWEAVRHGPGGTDVKLHYIRKRQADGGRYKAAWIDPQTGLLYPEFHDKD